MRDLKSLLDRYEYVSFDLFDTLVFRTVSRPDEVFGLVALQAGDQGGGFPEARVAAESRARAKAAPREVTLEDIYREMPGADDFRSRLMALEKETEIRCTVPNRPMTELLAWCRRSGKTVIVTTDMYLDRDTISAILQRNGIVPDRLFISGEAGVTKFSGELFSYVMGAMGIAPSQLIHLGDNPRSDVQMPAACGIAAPGIDTCPAGTVPYLDRLNRGSLRDEHLRARVRLGLLGRRGASPEETTGYSVLGPFLVDFCGWLHRQKAVRQLDLLAFVAREGYLVKQCYETIYPEEAGSLRYVRLNKNLLRLPLLSQGNDRDALLKSIPERPVYTWAELASCLDVALPVGLPAEDRVAFADLASGKEDDRLALLLEKVRQESRRQADWLLRYVAQAGFSGKRVGLVNNSVHGSGQSMLESFFRETGFGTTLFGLQFIKSKTCTHRLGSRCAAFVTDGPFPAYDTGVLQRNALVLEHLLFEPCGTALRLCLEGDSVDAVCQRRRHEVQNDASVAILQQAALAFAADWRQDPVPTSDTLATQALVELLLQPENPDAAWIGALWDDDIDGDKPLVDSARPLGKNDWLRKSIPGICWQEAYLVSRIPAWQYRLFRLRLAWTYYLHKL